MKKYMVLLVAVLGFTFATTAQTKAEKKQIKKEMKRALKAEKKALRDQGNVPVVETVEAPVAVVEEKKVEVKFVGNPETPITFETLEIDKKDIKKGTDDLFSFKLKNTGVVPFTIERVQTSCGCTTANKPEGEVQPGETAEISVKYDTHRIGPFTKTITVVTSTQVTTVLTIKGNVLTPEGGVQEEAPMH
jgi:Protein of unknown function (DUF1573)